MYILMKHWDTTFERGFTFMLTLESIWREAQPETEVCTIEGTTKNMVLRAITEGAENFESLREKVRFCENNECAQINVSKRGCHENLQALLDVYLPVFALMTEGGGCQRTLCPPPAEDNGGKEGGPHNC